MTDMQDRIKELAIEAGILPNHEVYEEDLTRFAKAIARECIEQFQRAQYRSGYDVVDGKEVGRFDVGVIDIIRTRFGIKE